MGLNIKDERTHQLVRELAERTGTSQTAAVREAVAARLEELDRAAASGRADSKRQRVEQIVAQFQADLTSEERSRMQRSEDWLYDDAGLPR
jgi:antitoxin VapB